MLGLRGFSQRAFTAQRRSGPTVGPMLREAGRWLLGLAICCSAIQSGPVRAAESTPKVTVFFENNKSSLEGIYLGQTAFYSMSRLAEVTGVNYHWDSQKHLLSISGRPSGEKPILIGDEPYISLEEFVKVSGLIPTWDLGRGVVMLHREKMTMLNTPQGFSTPNRPGAVPDIEGMPFDTSLQGRLPAGWHFKNPLENNGPPQANLNVPGQRGMNLNILDRKSSKAGEVYIPKTVANGAFSVTVTDVERCDNLRGYYQPRGGHRFLLIHVSQKNVTDFPQVDPGKFYVQDTSGTSYEPLDEMSTVRPVILRPYGLNFGYLVYEIPDVSMPARLILTCVGQAPLAVSL